MSVDRRLRNGLHRSADALASNPFDALAAVQTTASRRRRRVLIARTAVAALALAGGAVAIPLATMDRRTGETVTASGSEDPSLLPGSYTVDVEPSDIAEQHGIAGQWVIQLDDDGTVTFHPPAPFGGNSSASYEVEGDQVSTDAFVTDLCVASQATAPLGVYRWAATADGLRFLPVTETCDVRRLLFTGQDWRRQ